MNPTDKRGWRLFSDLNNAFRRDSSINEFDIIPVLEPKKNSSPVILVEHKLGVEMWSVKILYQYAYNTLMAWRAKTTHKFIESQELICLTRAVVLLNAECYTAWNIRKELVESGDITVVDDLKLSAVVLTKHPKSSETFCHRRWLLTRYIDNHLQSSQGSTRSTGSSQDGFVSIDAIDLNLEPVNVQPQPVQNGRHADSPVDYHTQMKIEINVCRCAAEKYPCNYYAWSHRIWLLQHAYNCSTQVLLAEIQRTEEWVSKHISDICGYNYRQFLLTNLRGQADTLHEQFAMHYSSLLEKEHKFIQDLIASFPAHEAMWYHRKYVFHSLYSLYDSATCDTKSCQASTNQGSENSQKKTRLEFDSHLLGQKEIESVQRKELKSSNSAQKKFAENYLDWIHKAVIK